MFITKGAILLIFLASIYRRVRTMEKPFQTRDTGGTALHARIQQLIEKGALVEKEVLDAEARFLQSKGEEDGGAARGALCLAAAQAERTLAILQKSRRALMESNRPDTDDSAQTIPVQEALERQRAALQRLVLRVTSLVETDGGQSTDTAADTAAALRSLLQSRALLQLEVQKVQGAVDHLSSGSEKIKTLNDQLNRVTGALDMAQVAVKHLLNVQSREDVVLRLSWLVFILVVLYIFLQRGLGFFGKTIYV
ncbi:hypothetical protein AGDE_12396 [Angomonas deanei]|uniref:Sec20, putative n=1 Tax=Angomonas deanei TaxID=59799 RepID=A0A7G2CWM2_9TRYP|nr:hypothetical protein AGDE_12396 [Angomonas deanei]CAD2222843.1 Sec20, putative [Angomonas deanei]|eukprot:EPY24341.1 hypothetical protein AGDE_12396 [Angomonas deanei]